MVKGLAQHAENKRLRLEPTSLVARVVDSAIHRLRPLLDGRTVAVVTEQTVEQPFVLRALPEPPARVMDFGAFEGTLPVELAAAGYDVVARDLRGYPLTHPRITVDPRDIFEGVEPESFDAIVSVSTIEHVAIDDDDGDRRCVELLLEGLRPGGVLVATVPFGATQTLPRGRVYDRARIARVFPGADLVVFAKWTLDGSWERADAERAEGVVQGSSHAPVVAVACVTVRN